MQHFNNSDKVKKSKFLPHLGEMVRTEVLEVDEIEVTCWLKDYNMLGFINNTNMNFKMEHIGEENLSQVKCIEYGIIKIDDYRLFL